MGTSQVAENGLGALIVVTAVPAKITGFQQATRGDWGGSGFIFRRVYTCFSA